MKIKYLHRATFLAAGILAAAVPASEAQVTILSQNFDTDPINFSLPAGSEFIQDATLPTKYWNLSNALGGSLNAGLSGNATTYVTGQNMDAPLPFTPQTPAQIDFVVPATGRLGLTLSIDIAGLASPEDVNFVRGFLDSDGDTIFETQVFNFAGTGNLPYTETTTGVQLTAQFQTFTFAMDAPTAPDGNLRLRLELFNDTDSLNEASGMDNIRIRAIPEPTTAGLLLVTGMVGLARRRRSA